jgi:hypothetical protein
MGKSDRLQGCLVQNRVATLSSAEVADMTGLAVRRSARSVSCLGGSRGTISPALRIGVGLRPRLRASELS